MKPGYRNWDCGPWKNVEIENGPRFFCYTINRCFRLIQQEQPGDIHWSWLNVGVTGILENISSLIEWCPSGICWIMILWWRGQLMVSRPSWNVNGQRRWVCFWTDVRWTSRPWRRSGAAILQVSCKYNIGRVIPRINWDLNLIKRVWRVIVE